MELDGLERRYGERVALAGVSVRLEEGRTLGLLRPHGGSARVLGAELPKQTWKLHGRVGYLGHEPLLYRELSGRENLAYHARLYRLAAGRVDELLAAVGMERRAGDPV